MSVHLWSSGGITLCGWTSPPVYNDGLAQCQDCFELSTGKEYHGNEPRLRVATRIATLEARLNTVESENVALRAVETAARVVFYESSAAAEVAGVDDPLARLKHRKELHAALAALDATSAALLAPQAPEVTK